MTKFTVKCYDINWAVEAEDVCDNLPKDATDEDIEKEIEFVKQDLPDEVTLMVEAEDENELDDCNLVSDELSEQTGWLHGGFEYEIISKEEV